MVSFSANMGQDWRILMRWWASIPKPEASDVGDKGEESELAADG